jgi:uncharacterized delta-60 repeat protein
MKKTFLIFIATLLFSANIILAQTSYTPADFDYTFGTNGTPFSYEKIDRIVDVEANRAGELVVTDGLGIKIYDPNGNFLHSISSIGPANSHVLSGFIKIVDNDDIIVSGFIKINGIWERFLTKLDSNLNVDITFGKNGYSFIKPTILNYSTNAIAIQSDGKIILVGDVYEYPSNLQTFKQFTTRFNQNGTIDTTFGNRGTVIESINNAVTEGLSVEMQGENIVVGGIHNGNLHIIVYDKSGNREKRFNGGNILIGVGDKIAVQQDNKIVALTSYFHSNKLSIARLNTNGTYDQSFGLYPPYGIVTNTLNLSSSSIYISKVILNDRGEIVVAGGFNQQSFIARYATRGYLDQNFQTSYSQPSYMITGTNLLDFNSLGRFSTLGDVTFQGRKMVVASNFFGSGVFGSVIARLND